MHRRRPDLDSDFRNVIPRFTPEARKAKENLGAAAIELTPDELAEIDEAASKIAIHGARRPTPWRSEPASERDPGHAGRCQGLS